MTSYVSKADSKYPEPYEDEEIICEGKGTPEDHEFDTIVGALEDITMGGELDNAQKLFCEEHCEKFSDSEENKIEYMDIFNDYTALIENTLNSLLAARIPGFNMQRFEELLSKRQDEVSGEIFELLTSLGDFSDFKDMMIQYKRLNQRAAAAGDLKLSGQHMSSP